MANTQITGRADIQIDGQVVRSLPGATLTMDGEQREPVYAGNEFLYRSTPQAPEMDCKIAHTKDQSIRFLTDLVDALVVFTTDNNVVFYLRNAWTMEPPQLDSGNGEISLKMSGQSVDEN